MKLHWKAEKKNYIWLGVMAVLAVGMLLASRYPVWVLPAFVGLFFLISCTEAELSDKIPWIWSGLIIIGGSIFTEKCIQMVILDPEFNKILKSDMRTKNTLLVLAVYLVLHALLSRPALAAIAAHSFLMLMAFTDYFVYIFRENEITWADVSTIGTGLSVAGNYSFKLHSRGALVIMLSILFITLMVKCVKVKFDWHWVQRSISAVVASCLILFVMQGTAELETQTWEQKGSYQNGFILNFALSIRDNFISAPDGYSARAIEDIAKDTEQTEVVENVPVNSKVKNPTVIVIMDESFADLNVLGPLETNVADVMPFVHSLQENTVKGYAVASVFGAKTPNSEWEYMTGNSMAYLPSGSVVYQQYIDQNPTSIVSTMKNCGYTTVAMHPYLSTGWRRNTVYPKLGFDEMYFLDEPSGFFDETKVLRKYITDEELFDKIIDRFNSKKKDERLFFMGITMQNHGGYSDYYSGFNTDVIQSSGMYMDVNQYLTIAHRTDEAVEKLITYFRSVNEPVEIVFFGDHQPSLNSQFYRTLNGKGMAGLTMDELENFFKVPFFIWTNYETEAAQIDCTSLNYLSTLTLERGNFELPLYNKFQTKLMDVIPAINARGYYSIENGRFIHLNEATGEEKKWLEKYQMLQYNNMFDKKNRNKDLFPYIEEK